MTYTTEQLEQMLAAATPGPWVTQEKECDEFWFADGYLTSGPAILWIADQADATLIAASPTITAELIAARKRIAELDGALRALIDLNDNHGPFGGEMYQDRIDRTWDRARAALEPKP